MPVDGARGDADPQDAETDAAVEDAPELLDVDPQDAAAAVDATRADGRLDDLLADNAHLVETVGPATSSAGLVVTYGFDEPVDGSAYPLDACAVDTGGEPITGIVWLVQDDEVAAVSPRWGDDLACGY